MQPSIAREEVCNFNSNPCSLLYKKKLNTFKQKREKSNSFSTMRIPTNANARTDIPRSILGRPTKLNCNI